MFVCDEFIDLDVRLSDGTLLLNIETTGLSPRNAFIYMIGMGWKEHHSLQTRCLLADSRMEERRLMESFHDILPGFKRIVTFGGQSFSWRFMTNRWTNYGDDESDLFAGRILEDIQKDITPFKAIFDFADLKKYTVEDFVGFHRHSDISGKDLMAVFAEWERNHDEGTRSRILAHHRDDMLSLIHLCRLSAYTTFWKGNFKQITSWQLENRSCSFSLLLELPVPQPIHYETEHCTITVDNTEAILYVPVYEGQLKYFLPGPVKDYYYLPAEDQAVHRSIACYVDKAHRQRATAATCYTHMDGLFLPTGNRHIHPRFQTDFQSKEYYILYDPERWKNDPDILNEYISSCIKEPPQ